MNQNREDRQGVPTRASRMEPPEGSRETVEEGMSDRERMRNRESSSQDLGSTSDRAMFTDRESAEARNVAADHGTPPARERGMGSSEERNREDSGERSSGGISNRDLEREQSEQEQLPERGRSQSER